MHLYRWEMAVVLGHVYWDMTMTMTWQWHDNDPVKWFSRATTVGLDLGGGCSIWNLPLPCDRWYFLLELVPGRPSLQGRMTEVSAVHWSVLALQVHLLPLQMILGHSVTLFVSKIMQKLANRFAGNFYQTWSQSYSRHLQHFGDAADLDVS